MLAFLLGQAGQDALGSGGGGQDAFDGRQRIGAETAGTLQGGQPVRTLITGQQGQEVLGLVFALAVVADQFVKEATGHRSQLGEALLQQGIALLGILQGMVAGADLPLRGECPRQQAMLGDILQVWPIDEDLVFGDPDWQQAADIAPGDRIEVLAIGNKALGVNGTVEDTGAVVRLRWQGNQVWYFPGVACQRRFFGGAMDPDIGLRGQPLLGEVVELCQGGEGTAVEQIGFHIVEGFFYLALGLSCQLHPIWTVPTELFGSPIPFTLSTVVSSPW